MPREFFGVSDVQHVTLRSVFPLTSLCVSSPVEISREVCLCVEGPERQLSFLHPHLINLVKQTPYREEDRWGVWTHIQWREQPLMLVLWYRFGTSWIDRIELVEHKFRRDMVFHCDLKLSELSVLEVTCFGHCIIKSTIGLPEELEENGSIEFPQVQLI